MEDLDILQYDFIQIECTSELCMHVCGYRNRKCACINIMWKYCRSVEDFMENLQIQELKINITLNWEGYSCRTF